MLELWTDGSAWPNPGPGGFAVILEQEDGTGKPVILGREAQSSNIRMEGWAIVSAIRGAKGRPVRIHTDSELWVKIATEWMRGWASRGWKKPKGQIANLDIVKELYRVYDPKQVQLVWTKGHVGTELNEMADFWAGEARKGAKL